MKPLFLVIDLFCGAGGVTTGFEQSCIGNSKIAKVIACINHDELAIASHAANHKGVKHFTEDIRTLDLTELTSIVKSHRTKYPDAKLIVWASLECTNFSKAKGGKSRNADSRTLAEHLCRYIDHLKPDYLQIENVVEFMSWGDLNEHGRPIKMKNGRDYMRWVRKVKSYNYKFDHRVLNVADYGAHTTRKRYFGIFARPTLPIIFPDPTHEKNPSKEKNLFNNQLKKWLPVKEVLDFSDEGNSILTRKKTLSEKTLARIYAGLIKYIAGGSPQFIMQRNGGNPESKICSIDVPARTITATGGNLNIVQSQFLLKYHGNGKNINSVNEPYSTITTRDRLAKIETTWLDKHYSGKDNHQSIVLIKQFMAEYGIVDIKMRMLKISELLKIQGFPDGYILKGNQSIQKKFIGNAQPPVIPKKWIEAMGRKILETRN